MGILDIISFGVGIVVRLFNEHQKASERAAKFNMAVAARNNEVLKEARADVQKSTFLQEMSMLLLIVALLVAAAFPVLALVLDVPLVILWERTVSSGFWIFSSTKTLATLESINGLYLVPEIMSVIVHATQFVFGAMVGGLGRR